MVSMVSPTNCKVGWQEDLEVNFNLLLGGMAIRSERRISFSFRVRVLSFVLKNSTGTTTLPLNRSQPGSLLFVGVNSALGMKLRVGRTCEL